MGGFSSLILTVGIPASGKTRWVVKYKKTHPITFVISTDDLREELTGTRVCDPTQSAWIHEEARKKARDVIEHPEKYGLQHGIGPEIIIDSTNVDVEEWIKYKRLGSTLMSARLFDVSVDRAMENQAKRERQIPRYVLEDKYQTLQRNLKYMPYFFNFIYKKGKDF